MYELLESMKTYAIAAIGLLTGVATDAASVAEVITIFLSLALVLSRLVIDAPAAKKTIKNKIKKRKDEQRN